jgi:RHS repeat-associated protein
MERTGSKSYYAVDEFGSVVAILDAVGSATEANRFDAWGVRSIDSIGVFGYTGREPSGVVVYYRARYYEPSSGRFVSEDPIGFLGGDISWADWRS